MDYRRSIAHLNSFINFERLPEPRFNTQQRDIDRFRVLLQNLGTPQSAFSTIHIAGTKGKGSTAAILASILCAAGYRVGVYTSPHLITVRERMRIDGRIISKREFASVMSRIAGINRASNGNDLTGFRTVFEHLTAAALLWFASRQVDVAILEAGLGGRLDATVVVDPVVSVLTPIGLDHTAILGDTIAEIAADKAHIIKFGIPAISACQSPEALNELQKRAHLVGADLHLATGRKEFKLKSCSFTGQEFLSGREGLNDCMLKLNLPGRFQLDNVSTALTVVDVLRKRGFNISIDAVSAGLRTVRWLGRMQYVKGKPPVILDGSHNIMAVEALLESLIPLIRDFRLRVVFSALRSKPIEGMLGRLSRHACGFHLAPICFPKSANGMELASLADSLGLDYKLHYDLPSAFESACSEAGSDEVILATGSLYLVGEILRARRGLNPPPRDGGIDDSI